MLLRDTAAISCYAIIITHTFQWSLVPFLWYIKLI